MSSGPRAAGRKARISERRKILPKSDEICKQWGPGWEAEWLAGWEEAEQEYPLQQRRNQEPELGM